ncbi:hypothetical protein [Clostridium oryzae]|uniref:MaoC like domain protein n=1 Tax=Clostridium oryzae TaxID=1450648 RepID=A0A1V4IRL1_9CLOT|nr:hypothetical protein [Clostridium oryzae]OPJ62107.1 hypothetical protein CLORY_19300 [Clostridium oryzae]
MIDLFKAFCTSGDLAYEGAFIAKIKYERFIEKANSEDYKTEIVKSSKRLCIISCSGYFKDEVVETMTVYLMMNVSGKQVKEPEAVGNQGSLWRSFSKQEIADFSHSVGDTNSIHLSDNPVVQGMFLLKELCTETQAKEIEVKFTYPVYGDNPVYLKREGNTIEGFSNDFLCFQAESK